MYEMNMECVTAAHKVFYGGLADLRPMPRILPIRGYTRPNRDR